MIESMWEIDHVDYLGALRNVHIKYHTVELVMQNTLFTLKLTGQVLKS